jgi:hypothetical protein
MFVVDLEARQLAAEDRHILHLRQAGDVPRQLGRVTDRRSKHHAVGRRDPDVVAGRIQQLAEGHEQAAR